MSSNGKGLSSPKGKKIMNYAYGIGASIVIIGALFKILHWPGAKVMLTLGMGTEALLFFLGSFEPPHQEGTKWDWTKVYPNLTPEKSPEELLLEEKGKKKKGKNKSESIAKEKAKQTEQAQQIVQAEATPATPKVGAMSGLSEEDMVQWNENVKQISSTVASLGKLTESSKVSEEYISKLSVAGDAVEQLSKAQEASAEIISSSSENLAQNYKVSSEKFDLTMSTAAEKFDSALEGTTDQLKEVITSSAEKFDKSMENVAAKVNNDLGKASEQASETLKGSTNAIAKSYAETAEKFEDTFTKAYSTSASEMTSANNKLADSYKQVTEALNLKLEMIKGSTSETGKALQDVSKNLTAINSVYELQLNTINEELKIKEAQTATQANVNDQLSQIQKAVVDAVAANQAYQAESEKLKNNIADLNKVYGNMLSSLNS